MRARLATVKAACFLVILAVSMSVAVFTLSKVLEAGTERLRGKEGPVLVVGAEQPLPLPGPPRLWCNTTLGPFEAELYPETAPHSVARLQLMVHLGFFDLEPVLPFPPSPKDAERTGCGGGDVHMSRCAHKGSDSSTQLARTYHRRSRFFG